MAFTTLIYQQIKNILPIESTRVLWLNTHEFLPAKPVEGALCRPLGSDDMHKLSIINEFDISKQLADDFDALEMVGIGMFVQEKLAGYSLFCTELVPAKYNRGDERLNGIEINLPPGTRCLVKSVILPEFRGQRLHSALVRYAIDHFGKDTVTAMVTTVDKSNKAFLSSVRDQGFESVGKAMEISMFGKSVYKLPKPVDSNTGQASEEEDSCIVLRKAA